MLLGQTKSLKCCQHHEILADYSLLSESVWWEVWQRYNKQNSRCLLLVTSFIKKHIRVPPPARLPGSCLLLPPLLNVLRIL